MKSFLQFLLFVLLITLALAGLYSWKSGSVTGGGSGPAAGEALPAVKPLISAASVPGLAALDEELSRVAEAVVPSVVSLTSRKDVAADPRQQLIWQLFGVGRPLQEVRPQGAGAIVSKDGHIVTNFHVVDGAKEIEVTLGDGRVEKARVLGADERTDLAVLKIDAPGLRPLALADSDKVRVGQFVLAVGNPFGFQETITQGIISARGRLFSSELTNEFFQTDAAINPGNSGGPLVNLRGELVGINNFIYTETGGNQGIGFSIPANTVRRVVDQILEFGRVLRPYLGVVLQPLDPNVAQQLGLPDARGALVASVLDGSPAASAGLRGGDVVRKFGGKDVENFNDLRKFVASAEIGKEVKLDVLRDGKEIELPVKILEQPAMPAAAAVPLPAPPQAPVVPRAPVPPADGSSLLAGVTVQAMTPSAVRRYGLPENISGVLVTGVDPGSAAGGVLKPGDAVEQINDQPVSSPEDFAEAAAELGPGDKAVVLLARGRVRSFAVVGR